jgi:hypothetical protein
MAPLGFFNRCLGLRDCLLPALALLRPGGFFLQALAFTLPLLFLEPQRGPPGGLVVDLAGGLLLQLCVRLF